jgi:hypothetical protein
MEEPVIKIAVEKEVYGEAEFSLYETSIDEVLKYLVHDEKNVLKNINKIDTATYKKIPTFKKEISYKKEGNEVGLPLESSGVYFLEMSIGGQNAIVVLTDREDQLNKKFIEQERNLERLTQ